MRLTAVEKRLCKAVEAGISYTSGGEIRAKVLRRLVLSLPLDGRLYQLTSAGISIRGATIRGRIVLDRVRIACGGRAGPIVLHDCTLDGGFSGSHSHFSRLSFKNCIFASRGNRHNANATRPIPTIDLTGAELDTEIDMGGVQPQPKESGLLWIRATGIRVGGGIELSRCCLRAPDPGPGPFDSGRIEDALDLTLAKIDGDLTLLDGSRVNGRFKLRNAQIQGDIWLRGAKFSRRSKNEGAILMQGTRVSGFLMMDCPDNPGGRNDPTSFLCRGQLKLAAMEVGRSLCLYGSVESGDLVSHDLTVGLDLSLGAEIEGKIDLRDAKIGGTLDISELQAGLNAAGDFCPTKLSLRNATIGRSLRLMRPPRESTEEGQADATVTGRDVPDFRAFRMEGTVDLEGLSCDTLEDGVGTLWGKRTRIRMNHFVYRQTGRLPPERVRPNDKANHRVVGDWFLAKRAEGRGLWRLTWDTARLRRDDFWQEWQLRRNWIYQQFQEPDRDPLSTARHIVKERDYRPQPFEQAIRVARAEGRENFAIRFEMLKQEIEWRHFNQLMRSWLALIAIVLASLWLLWNHGPGPELWVDGWTYTWTWLALLVTVGSIIGATAIRRCLCWCAGRDMDRPGGWPRVVTWIIFFVPALLLFLFLWLDRPFHFIVALLIFLAIRSLGVTAHFVMRWSFGYLRRPVRAIVTLILAFGIGWWGTHLANHRNMLVVTAAPVAPIAGPDGDARYPKGYDATGIPHLFGSQGRRPGLARELSCAATVSEPLYALDVLIPIVDLGEERRCEVRRIADHHGHRSIVHPKSLGLLDMFWSIPDLPLNDHRFWWWMKAIYALFGWIIVSLSILTFAQVNKIHAEPPTEHK